MAEWRGLPVPDVSWLLYVTDAIGRGARYGMDVVDVAPPPILWYGRPAMGIAGLLGWSTWHGFLLLVVGTGFLSLLLTFQVARRSGLEPRVRWALAAGSVLAVLALPAGAFGEREHVALILVLPYVMCFAARESDTALPASLAAWIGLQAGFGFAIKPHFAIPWAVLAGLVLLRRRGPSLIRRPEFLAATGTTICCLLLVLWTNPAYVTHMQAIGPLYLRYDVRSPLFVGFQGESGLALVPWIAAAAAVALWQALSERPRAMALYLAAGAAAFHLVATMQLKGWRYHYLPGLGLGFILLSMLTVAGAWATLRPVSRAYRLAVIAVLIALAGATTRRAAEALSGRALPTFDPAYESLLPVVRREADGRPLAVLSSNLASAFPLTTTAGVPWAYRSGGLPWLAAFHAERVRARQIVRPPPFAERPALEQRLTEEVVHDLRASRPGLIVVPMPLAGSAHFRLFDYLAYFATVPGFADLFASYRQVSDTAGYRIFKAIGPAAPAPVQGRLP